MSLARDSDNKFFADESGAPSSIYGNNNNSNIQLYYNISELIGLNYLPYLWTQVVEAMLRHRLATEDQKQNSLESDILLVKTTIEVCIESRYILIMLQAAIYDKI